MTITATADDLFDLLSPSPFADLLTTTDALNAEGDPLFDSIGFDPFVAEAAPLATDGAWPCCPLHGFHDAADNGTPLSFCDRCETMQ